MFLHVDDIAVFGKDLTPFKNEIKSEFDMKDLGQADLLLGIKVFHDSNAIIMTQHHYINSLLDLYGMNGCRPVSTPLVPNSHLAVATVEEVNPFNSLGVNFRSAVGALSYLSSATQPDIAFAVSTLSQFLEQPGITHYEAFTHVLRYLAGSQTLALVYKCQEKSPLEGYTDADWGNCLVNFHSITGYVMMTGDHLLSWKSSKQDTVSLSLAEAEYKSLSDLSWEVAWIASLVNEVKIDTPTNNIRVAVENKAEIDLANSETAQNGFCTKHMSIRLHFV